MYAPCTWLYFSSIFSRPTIYSIGFFFGTLVSPAISTSALIPSYSLLQDMFYEQKQAGFNDLERGVRGSTTQHLSVLDYKIQQDNETLARIEKQVEEQQKELASVSSQLVVESQTSKTFNQLNELGKKKLFSKVELAENDYKGVIVLAKEGILSRRKIADLTRQLYEARDRLFDLQRSWDRLYEHTKEFRQAMRLAPQRVKQLFVEIFSRAREEREARRNLHCHGKKGEQ